MLSRLLSITIGTFFKKPKPTTMKETERVLSSSRNSEISGLLSGGARNAWGCKWGKSTQTGMKEQGDRDPLARKKPKQKGKGNGGWQ